ncbi:tyrosine-type recombinase/integrase [Campylobacter geochelonis]|uniref:tyrosine-type recombinase/integrase n=1 Tax=Campylobacter geochelonis TaxID=1780362 RepID=UPI000770803D|nr:hypothetical protein [Campylobacter geochelonis]CZE51532.1 integrase phage family protein [Campylobacter geochelonis]
MILDKNITPIKQRKGFKTAPDIVLSEFKLPISRKNPYCENIDKNLRVKISKTKHNKKLNISFYVVNDAKLKKLGEFPALRYNQAQKARDEYLKNIETGGKNTLKSVFELYLQHKYFGKSQKTVEKRISQFKHFHELHDKPVKKIKHEQIICILDRIFHSGKFESLKEIFNLVQDVFNFAKVRKIIASSPLSGEKWNDHYKLPKSVGYGYLDSQNINHLRLLINYVFNYKNSTVVREALIMGLCTALRSQNVRELKKEQVKQDENGNYYLEFEASQTKTKKQQKLGIPTSLAEWLLTRQNIDFKGLGVVFPAPTIENKIGILSDSTLSDALGGFRSIGISNGRFVFHSFRKVLSSYYRVLMAKKGEFIDDVGVELTLFHEQNKIEKVYNKAIEIDRTRKILTNWLTMLNDIAGFDILGAQK